MEKSKVSIAIIGAGVSGLIAAKVLEEEGYAPHIYEKSDRPGGRLKTDIVDGYQLDHGFQVLLDAYPMAKKYLNLNDLELQKFLPGAVIFQKGKQQTIGDPLRDISLLWSTLGASIGNFSDKWKIMRLASEIKNKTIDQIFAEEEVSTRLFLEQKGFSEAMIANFFTPFYTGIFLEPNLATSSRMFNFVFKMFGEGFATLPKNGIAAIAAQLVSSLAHTEIHYNTTVIKVDNEKINFADGREVFHKGLIIATEPLFETPKTNHKKIAWKHCDTLYFSTKNRIIDKALIGLIADEHAFINNIFYHTSLKMGGAPQDELLSVTVVKEHQLSKEELIKKVQEELLNYCGITEARFLKHYDIPSALPQLVNLKNSLTRQEVKLSNTIFLAGDYLLNGSLNAAMISGENAALSLINDQKGN